MAAPRDEGRSVILDRYIARRFTKTFVATLAVFFLILGLIDFVEQISRFADDASGLGSLLALTLLNVPQVLYEILPLITVIAAVALFLALARSSELIVTRGSGRSALRALVGPGVVALLIGVVGVAVFNPIVASTSREYEFRVGRLDGETSALAVSDDGLWLRQGGSNGTIDTVIHAARANLDGTSLTDVTFLTFDDEGSPSERIEADRARLDGGAWRLSTTRIWQLDDPNPEAGAESRPTLVVGSNLTADRIRDSFGTPSSIPVWELPKFIARLEEAGLAARRHRVHLQSELALPSFLLAMVLIAAGFTLRHQRGRRTGAMVLGAVLAGFAAYVLRELAIVLGESGQIPPGLAAWTPPLATMAAALGLLLHLEEG